jgi:hypothetical protein
MPFEAPIGLDGSITSIRHDVGGGVALGGFFTDEPTIISTSQTWRIHVRWETRGPLNALLTGNWHIHAYLESIGPGAEISVVDPADHVIPLVPAPGVSFYAADLDVPANVVGLPAGVAMDTTGLYKLVVALTYIGPTGVNGPIAAYEEGPVLQFYNS